MDDKKRDADYQKIQVMIMDTLQLHIGKAGQLSDFNESADNFVSMIEFLEQMHVSTILSMVGSFIAAHNQTKDDAFKALLMNVIRGAMDQAAPEFDRQLRRQYKLLMAELKIKDPLAEKTHNQKLADSIRRELNGG